MISSFTGSFNRGFVRAYSLSVLRQPLTYVPHAIAINDAHRLLKHDAQKIFIPFFSPYVPESEINFHAEVSVPSVSTWRVHNGTVKVKCGIDDQELIYGGGEYTAQLAERFFQGQEFRESLIPFRGTGSDRCFVQPFYKRVGYAQKIAACRTHEQIENTIHSKIRAELRVDSVSVRNLVFTAPEIRLTACLLPAYVSYASGEPSVMSALNKYPKYTSNGYSRLISVIDGAFSATLINHFFFSPFSYTFLGFWILRRVAADMMEESSNQSNYQLELKKERILNSTYSEIEEDKQLQKSITS